MGSKLALVLFGICVALVAVELGLRLAGRQLMSSQRQSSRLRGGDEQAVRILCLGESTTAEMFSDEGDMAWPKALERLLNSAGPRRYRVYNEAVPGLISSVITAELDRHLAHYRPQLVISMVGVNDRNLGTRFLGQTSWWHELRIYKLMRWALEAHQPEAQAPQKGTTPDSERYLSRLRQHGDAIMAAITSGQRKQAVRLLGRVREQEPKLARHLFSEISTRTDQRGLTADGMELMMTAYGKGKADLWLLMKITSMLAHGPYPDNDDRLSRQAVQLFVRGQRSQRPGPRLVSHFASIYANLNEPIPAMERVLRRHRVGKHKVTAHENTVHNYRAMERKLRRAGVRWIAMSYPLTEVGAIKNIFSREPLRRYPTFYHALQASFPPLQLLPRYRHIIFVENRDNFRRALRAQTFETLFSDRFGTIFGHTTNAGHRLIAENLAQVIRAARLVK